MTKQLLAVLLLCFPALLMGAPRCITVKAGDAESLLQAIDEANRVNADSLSARLYILVPNGVYDLGSRVLTTLTGHNVAIVGESMRGTVIVNRPPKEGEGIGKTATLRLMTSDTYLQDLTLQNALDYYAAGSAGRAVALHDKGTRTICNCVCLLSYQDTYYTDNVESQSYLVNSEIHGTVDFICGAGDAYFDHCTLVTERRNRDGSGRNVIAAPRTADTPWGYVFESCVVWNRQSDFFLARGWHTTPRCTWLNTRLMTPERLLPTRFDPQSIRAVDCCFGEYATVDAEGRLLTPPTNVIAFEAKGQRQEAETVLTPKEVRRYVLKKIFPDWRPEKIVERTIKEIDLLREA